VNGRKSERYSIIITADSIIASQRQLQPDPLTDAIQRGYDRKW
jgi:hypothetical protein